MNNEHDQAEELLNEALSHTPEQRPGFLAAACGSNVVLRDRVAGLVHAYEIADGFLAETPARTDTSGGETPGNWIGGYKLLEKIGEGGFGVVYRAEQNEPVKRPVALKIIKLGMDTRQVVARFEAERQALALMDHPNIARIFDGGATGTGRPFFVMELVRGVPITHYCDAQQLPVPERLRLFIQVCQAVQHAHQKGIIHRDIKPSNILVTVNDGIAVPKVIDFGVAKATQQELTEKTILTQFHQFIGTPAYMSPEQAEMTSVDIDTRSDIYSLGVLLYELLTGTTPFSEKRLRHGGPREMQRIISEEEPERPSTRWARRWAAADPAKVRATHNTSSIDADLDWIVMKCLEKDRNRRYETTNGLALDVQRYLQNEPVRARPPSALYRFRKFVRRQKLGSGAGVFAIMVLLSAIVVSSWQAVAFATTVLVAAALVSAWQALRATRAARAATEQAAAALEQAEIARSVKDFLAEHLLGNANPFAEPEPAPARRALLEQVARQVEAKFPKQPLIEADIRFALGRAFCGISDFDAGASQLERALAERGRRLGAEHSDTLETLGELVWAYSTMGKLNQAEELLAPVNFLSGASRNDLSKGAAWLLFARGHFLLKDRRPAEGLSDLQQASVTLNRVLERRDYRLGLVGWIRAYTTQRAGRWDEAEALWAEHLERCARDYSLAHPMSAMCLWGQGSFLIERGQAAQAIGQIERAVSVLERTIGVNHSETLDAACWLGAAYEQTGRIEDAAKLFADLYPRRAKQLPLDSARWQCREIARFFVRQRRFQEARSIYELLRRSFELHPLQRPWELDMLIETVVGTEGWLAAAEMCRRYSKDNFRGHKAVPDRAKRLYGSLQSAQANGQLGTPEMALRSFPPDRFSYHGACFLREHPPP